MSGEASELLSGLALGDGAETEGRVSPETKSQTGEVPEEALVETGTRVVVVEANQPGSQGSGRTELADVKDDALFEVLKRLDFRSLYAVEATCRRFRRLATHKTVYNGIRRIQMDAQVPELKTGQSLAWTQLAPGRKGTGLERLAKQLVGRGARPTIVELTTGTEVGVQSPDRADKHIDAVCEALGIIQPRTLLVSSPVDVGFHYPILSRLSKGRRLECLVLHAWKWINAPPVNEEWHRAVKLHFIRSQLGPGVQRRLRCLLLFGNVWDEPGEPYDQGAQKAFREAWEGSKLLCFRTPQAERSFLKGPRDQPPHPDLLRLSKHYPWTH